MENLYMPRHMLTRIAQLKRWFGNKFTQVQVNISCFLARTFDDGDSCVQNVQKVLV